MVHDVVHPPKARPGDKVAVLSPSFAAPGVAPAVHEQAMRRLTEVTGLIPVEYPTTRRVGASPRDRAADVNAAFADPGIRAVLAVIGGEDQITVIPHLDPELVRADPKPFLGHSDNTNLLSWLWVNGVAGFYGGSTQVQLGPGPAADQCHVAALRAALLTGERLEVTNPGESEDFGKDWTDPAALTAYGDREPAGPWTWAGALFPAIALVLDNVWAVAAGTARQWFAGSPRRLARIGGISGLAMIGLGVGIAATGRSN